MHLRSSNAAYLSSVSSCFSSRHAAALNASSFSERGSPLVFIYLYKHTDKHWQARMRQCVNPSLRQLVVALFRACAKTRLSASADIHDHFHCHTTLQKTLITATVAVLAGAGMRVFCN